jgi:SAM-dependent methyltransferase
MRKPSFKCTICSSKNGRDVLTINHPDRFERSIGISNEGYLRSWVECDDCGVVTNILPSSSLEKLSVLRSSYYEVDFMGSDIGAGTGVFLSRLMDETAGAWQYLGVEPDPRAAAHLRQLKKFAVVESMYLDLPELRGFNLVTLNKVLEHIEQPLPFLMQVVQSLVPEDGLLYVEVPDKLTIRLRSSDDNILGALHCHLYDPTSLAHLLRLAGLELLCVNRIAELSGKLSVYAFAARVESFVKKGLPHE